MRIWTEENDRKHIYIDVGDGNEVVEIMYKNGIFVERWNGTIGLIDLECFSLQRTATTLFILTDFYKRNGWEITEQAKAVASDFCKRAEEERERREEERLRLWMEEQERQKKIQQPQLYKVRVRQRRGYKGILY